MYEVSLEPPAERFLNKRDKAHQKRIISRLRNLEENPKLGKPLKGNLAGLWTIRFGDFRAVYQIKENKLLVLILDIGHRKIVYDKWKKLMG